MEFEPADRPPTFDKTAWTRDYRQTAKGRQVQRVNRDAKRERKIVSKPFVAWDGEGETHAGRHLYTLLAHSGGGHIAGPGGLSTDAVLRFLLGASRTHPDAIHVIYGGSYDFNLWVRDLPHRELERLYKTGRVRWGQYRIKLRLGKMFWVSDRVTSITVYDVISFFQCAFVKACDDYLGDAWENRAGIIDMKARRGTFTGADAEAVALYNASELRNLVVLMTELRARLDKVGLRPTRWDGPGAVASMLLKRERVKDAMPGANVHRTPDAVAEASRYAYAGGRFEPVRFGHHVGRVYEYDINSAYPAAMGELPDLAHGRWVHHRGGEYAEPSVSSPGAFAPFAVHHVSLRHREPHLAGPLFRRSSHGTISYPQHVQGWYWHPEVLAARAWVDQQGGTLDVLESWTYVPDDPSARPFAFVADLYRERQALKKVGDGAHVGIKLGLNSLYGKLAQQVGWRIDEETGQLRLPPYHCLEWAGYITSHCRARLLGAALGNLPDVVAFETDALFVTRPLHLPCGTDLGEWEVTEFEDIMYAQSGVYFGTLVGGKEVVKVRGFDRGTVTRERVQDAWDTGTHQVEASLTRFIGLGLALMQGMDTWNTWETLPKVLRCYPQGKRVHELSDCPCLRERHQGLAPGLHLTTCPDFHEGGRSFPFALEWIDDQAYDALDVAFMRRELKEWETEDE